MKMRTLGRTGVQVSPLTLGAMMFGAWGTRDHDESVRIMHTALDAGVNVIDPADVYANGESEEIVGKALRGRRDNVVVATKCHAPMGTDPNESGNSRRWIMRAVEGSLKRLQLDHLDLYQIHRPSPLVDVEETLEALTDLQRAGKIRYFGSSTFPAAQIVQAQWAAERRHTGRFVTEQPPYSLLVRGIENDVLPVCQEYNMGVLPWSPLSGGWLSGKWRLGEDNPQSRRALMIPDRYDMALPGNQAKLAAADALGKLADEAGTTLVELAIAWVIRHPGVTSAIIGPRTMEQLTSQLGAADLVLTDDVLDAIDEIVPPGTNLNAVDGGYDNPALTKRARRRRR